MSFVPVAALLRDAEERGYAVGAFNCNNMELLQAVVAAAEKEQAPVILQASQGAIRYAGLNYLTAMARAAARSARVPVALHLDHGTSFEQAVRCIAAGFSSVMIDGSRLPLEENVALTRRVVEVAKAAGVSVEGELGRIMGVEDEIKVEEREAFFTDPEEARYFVERTGVDSLAVSVGTAHGHYRGEPRLDFERLSRIKELVRIPLVLHGASGVPDEAIREAVRRGVRKINIDTEIREAFVGALRRELAAHPQEIDPRKVLGPAREAAEEVVRAKMRLFGCAGKAWI